MSLIKDTKYELGQIDFSERSLKKFGLTIGLIFLAIGLVFIWKNSIQIHSIFFILIGLYLTIFGILLPKKLSIIYKYWMILALVLGWFVSRIILTILFFLIITPIGYTMKILGKDILNISNKKNTTSFWILKNSSYKNLEKMF